MQAKHTTGPWNVGEMRHQWDIVIRGPKQEPIALSQVAGYLMPEARANARLIAASPDLLEACQTALSAIDSGIQALNELAVSRLRAAVAKAHGMKG